MSKKFINPEERASRGEEESSCTPTTTKSDIDRNRKIKAVFRIAETIAARCPPPWHFPQRGRPPKFSPRKHAAICATVVSLNLSYRQFEGASPLVLGETIDHSAIGWAFKRLAPSYTRLLLRFLARRIEPLFQPEFFVMDSTGISTNFYSRKRRALRWRRKKVFLKLHALVGCSQKGFLFVQEASVTGEGCHDLMQVGCLLEAAEGRGRPLLADSAYDYHLAYRLAKERGFRPVIKPKEMEGSGA